jgi:succinate dehydrogenase / fumarate reductase cytochrome b subunit
MAEHLKPRPLSPFVTIFRWPVTMATSIVHRATGVGLAGGLIVLVWWLVAASSGPDAYNVFIDLAETTIGQIFLFGFTWALAYHAVNGIRHLAWDLGYGFEVRTADISGIAVFVLSVLIAIGVFAVAYAGYGGYYQ